MAIIRRDGLAIGLALALGVAALLLRGTSAQSGCTSSLLGLTPCLNYVNGNTTTPSTSCCSRLAGIVQSQPQCLCLLLSGAASSYGYNINQTQALALPGACNVQTPPVSRCNAMSPSNSPTSSPTVNTPADSNQTTPSAPAVPSASKRVPAKTTDGDNTSGASKNQKFPLYSIVFALLFAPYFSSILNF